MRDVHTRQSWGICSFIALLLIAIILGACKRNDAPAVNKAQQLAWSTIIAGHTSGIVSRKSIVQVLFAKDVASVNAGNNDAHANLTIEPAIEGKLIFAGPREIVLTPSKELEPGKEYTVKVNSKGLNGVPQDLTAYQFTFRVQTPQFAVTLKGLETDPNSDARMTLRGTLSSADAEDATKIEQVITAHYLDQALQPTWTHSSDGLTHEFNIANLERQATAQALKLSWNGKPIAATTSGEQIVSVPARDAFLVTQIEAVEEQGRKQIQVHFSDSLSARQDLRGLIGLSVANKFTTRIENNILTIYPDGELSGEVTVNVEAGIRNERDEKLQDKMQQTVTFMSTKPQVRFVGKGVILPDDKVLSVPFEAVSARSVRVTALRIYDNNIAQFLQVNRLDGNNQIGRVGRFLWRKTIPLTGPQTGRWTRYNLDVSELVQKYPGGMFQLMLQVTPKDSAYQCANNVKIDNPAKLEPELHDQEDGDRVESSNWDYAEEYYGEEDGYNGNNWAKRDDPCQSAYFQYNGNVRAQRNLIASNTGLLAKRDQHGKLLIVATDLRTSEPLSGAKLTVFNFQNQAIGAGSTDSAGRASIETTGTPFLLVSDTSGRKGYLKLNSGNALPVSHFDVGGETVSKGLKGFIYGDRGVWRPGDAIYLTFVLQDKDKSLPTNHPVTLELYNPSGQLVQTMVNTTPVNGFYKFALKTADTAPTGDWSAKAIVGSTTYTKTVKVETVMPNRLKIAVDFGSAKLTAGEPLHGRLAAQWLSGATASGLKADIKLRLTPTATQFGQFNDFVFDDPARDFSAEPDTVFDGTLDNGGNAKFEKALPLDKRPPGMLTATFTTRVFEKGGAFSINRDSTTYAPYERFVGIRLPKGDAARDMLMTDKQHTIEIASLSADGKPVSIDKVQVTIYKVQWKWWWDKNGDSLAQYAQAESTAVTKQGDVATTNGRGQFQFEIKYPEWGRYLVRACDVDGGHCTGKTFYIDWPSWAGNAREQSGPAASVLTFTADKPEYKVGDTATIQLPESSQGRALVTLENGTGIIESRWVEPKPGNTRFSIPITAAMSPNIYVAVTLVQPHENKGNDRPIRLYGVMPLNVVDPATKLAPVITAADEWKPEAKSTLEVSEANGHAMTYTVAVVDEGLLGLTNYKTPNLHEQFYKREALGVTTWDLYDDVVGSYGAELERLLALGGSEGGKQPDESKTRFPPVAQYLGPFQLAAGAKAKHEIELPKYIGAVRIMVIAGDNSNAAYGSAEKSVYVRQPLMLLPTLPRVIGPGEDVAVPVSVFATKATIKNVTLSIVPDAYFQVVGDSSTQISFGQPEEKLGVLHLKSANKLGKSHVKFLAVSGEYRASADIYLDVRSANPATTRWQTRALQPGESWTTDLMPHGIAGTNSSSIEVTGVPPLNLESRLGYLINYPHGCLEQTTSSVFPQLYLPALVKLEDARKKQIEDNIRGGIERLRYFQLTNGGFSYWPGASSGFNNGVADGSLEGYNLWASTYASHFLIEAEKAGYTLPPSMKSGVIHYLKNTAQNWAPNTQNSSALDQAYRLYVLALAGQAEVGAMNRLRESPNLAPTERWILAAAYKLAGLNDAAIALVKDNAMEVREYKYGDYTFGSTLRDRAMLLQSALTLGRTDKLTDLTKSISNELSSQGWYSTQSVAYALMAMSRFAGTGAPNTFTFEQTFGTKTNSITASSAVYQAAIPGVPLNGEPASIRNTSQRVLFVTLSNRGIAASGNEDATAAGLELNISYTDSDGDNIDVAKLKQGTDVIANVSVKNASSVRIDNIALTQIVPAGWEIHNDRLDNVAASGKRDEEQKPRNAFGIAAGSRDATQARADYVDIRDDRVLQYFGLRSGESIHFTTRLNAAYLGKYYLPSVAAEAMYDATKNARTKGQWVEVVSQ